MIPIRDDNPTDHTPVMNYLIIVANLLVFLYELSLPEQALGLFFYEYGLVPAHFGFLNEGLENVGTVSFESYYPFFTNMFLHGGWMHFLGNMWSLYIFGDNIEDRMGSWGYLFFYLLCGVLASGAHFYMNLGSEVPALGASGAISGVMAAYMFLYPRGQIVFLFPIFLVPFFFRISALIYIGFWFALQVYSGASTMETATGVAFWAHIGGFVAGALLYRLFTRR